MTARRDQGPDANRHQFRALDTVTGSVQTDRLCRRLEDDTAAMSAASFACSHFLKLDPTMPRKFTMVPGFFVVFAVLVAAVQLSGCGGGGSPHAKTVKASGKVLYKGQPVAGASVAFLGDGKSVPALGRTDSQGRFELTTSEPGDGAVVGMHKVTVSKIVGPKAAAAPTTGVASMESMAKSAAERNGKENDEADTGMSLLPEKYSQAGTTTLQYEVKDSGTNDFTIELTD